MSRHSPKNTPGQTGHFF